jgi:GNAT superfamily N-acetyltransferase
LAAAGHVARHTEQIHEVKSCPGFPRSQPIFAGLALAQRLEGAEGSAGASFVAARGGEAQWQRIGGAYAMFDGVNSPLTQTFGLGMFEPATQSTLTELEDFFRARQAPVDHEVSPLAGVALLQELTRRGYAPLELSSVLFLDLAASRPDPPLNPALAIRMANHADRDAYAQAAAEGWGATGETASLIEDMGRIMFVAGGYTGFLVETDGRIVATAGLAIHHRVALLAGASTIPDARGQGAQRAVLAARLRYAAEAGCDLAMMVTEPGGASQRNAERHGFQIAYTRTKWRLAVPTS